MSSVMVTVASCRSSPTAEAALAIDDFTRYEPAPLASMRLPRRSTTADCCMSRSAPSRGSGWLGSYGTSEFTWQW